MQDQRFWMSRIHSLWCQTRKTYHDRRSPIWYCSPAYSAEKEDNLWAQIAYFHYPMSQRVQAPLCWSYGGFFSTCYRLLSSEKIRTHEDLQNFFWILSLPSHQIQQDNPTIQDVSRPLLTDCSSPDIVLHDNNGNSPLALMDSQHWLQKILRRPWSILPCIFFTLTSTSSRESRFTLTRGC